MEKTEKITMLHGAGGSVMHDFVKNYVVKYFGGLNNVSRGAIGSNGRCGSYR